MPSFENEPLKWFVENLRAESVLGQVLIQRGTPGFELRHEADRTIDSARLSNVPVKQARAISLYTGSGLYRPLKSAPNLKKGWRIAAPTPGDLELALNQLYPNAIADCYAARSASPPITDYRTFTNRQTGMYRIATLLTDAQAGEMITAACHAQFCLKRRLWSVQGLAPDPAAEKSMIPCLEPCAILLEFARRTMRLEQEPKISLELGKGEIETLRESLRKVQHEVDLPDGEAGSPLHPRRLKLLLQKLERVALPGNRGGEFPENH